MVKFISAFLGIVAILVLSALTFVRCGTSENSITVMNYGKYIEPEVLHIFEEETGIHVNYEEYITPENMYAKYKAGSVNYDLICTSDYMVGKLLEEEELLPIDFDQVPLMSNLDPVYFEYSESFDPTTEYSMPYFFGTVGLLYDTEVLSEEEVASWSVLWDPAYRHEIVMSDSVRDSFMPPLKYLGYSLNTTDLDQLLEAQQILLDQKELVLAYLVDESKDEMIAGSAAMALVYSGEAALAMEYNERLDYAVPEEGSNMWIDSWFIPKTCQNKEYAQQFLNFLCREDIAMMNFEYVWYATPNMAVFDALDSETQADEVIFPPAELLENCEIFKSLDDEAMAVYNRLWKEIKSH